MKLMSGNDKHFKARIVTELAVIFGSSIIVYLVSRWFDMFEKITTLIHEYKTMQLDEWITVSIYLVLCLAVFSLRRWKESRLAQKKLIDQYRDLLVEYEKINQLEGILPICLYCKKIRDDEDHWHEIEDYICEHSNAEFSHGVCPGCMQKHYPDVDEKDT